mmetsp:Transcript_46291/g.106869  ORF Transcript_46291/g.106869 Transcript_46291/m.106869 type:complete len:144 (+) Transcript_46291:75-506(+)
MDGHSTALLSGDKAPAGTVTLKRSTLALVGVALLLAGGLASWSVHPTSAPRVTAAVPATPHPYALSKEAPLPAATLLASIGRNATVLDPSKLYYSNCLLCFTCGESWTHQVAIVNRGAYIEFGAGCADPDHIETHDDAYVCCV